MAESILEKWIDRNDSHLKEGAAATWEMKILSLVAAGLQVTVLHVPPGLVKDGMLTIGSVSAPIYNPNQKMKVPDVLFYDNPQVITPR